MTGEQISAFVPGVGVVGPLYLMMDATTAGVIGVTVFLIALALGVWWLGRGKR